MRKSHAEMSWMDREAVESRREKRMPNSDSKRIRTRREVSRGTRG